MQGIQVMAALANMAQAVPGIQEAFDWVNAPEILKRGFEAAGTSELVIREDDEVQAIQQARAQAQAAAMQQQMAMQQQQDLMKNYKNLNEPVNPDSPMGELDQAVGG
jgi:carbamoylphosphate synthase large subunit